MISKYYYKKFRININTLNVFKKFKKDIFFLVICNLIN